MATKYNSEGFVSTPLGGQWARRKDEEDEAQFKEANTEYKSDFARIARTRRQRNPSKSESSRSPSPVSDNHYGDQLISQNLSHSLFYRRRIIV